MRIYSHYCTTASDIDLGVAPSEQWLGQADRTRQNRCVEVEIRINHVARKVAFSRRVVASRIVAEWLL